MLTFRFPLLLIVIPLGFVYVHQYVKRRTNRLSLPPGPKGLPIIGNLLDIPLEEAWLGFSEMKVKYGPIIHFDLFGQSLVVLNSVKATIELLERRAVKYAGRPKLTMAGELVGYENAISMSQYDDRFKQQRKLMSETLGKEKVALFQEVYESKVSSFVASLMNKRNTSREGNGDGSNDMGLGGNTTGSLLWKTQHYIGDVFFRVLYGIDIVGDDDPHMRAAHVCARDFVVLTTPGQFLVDVFPILRYVPSWVPFFKYDKKAEPFRINAKKMTTMPFETSKQQILSGDTRSSLVSSFVNKQLDHKSENNLKLPWIASTLLVAGSDTTVNALMIFFYTMARYPEVQVNAQEEIDRIIGSSRLPTFKDRNNLPYIEALCKEIHRMYPVTPLGFHHVLSSDDIYEGYHIPKGTMVLANIWDILHDPDQYTDPFEFKPERFLQNTEKPKPKSKPEQHILDPHDLLFGFGRRICPGRYIAQDIIFITIVTILTIYKITPSPGIEKTQFLSGFTTRPDPFDCIIEPRNPDAEVLLQEARELELE